MLQKVRKGVTAEGHIKGGQLLEKPQRRVSFQPQLRGVSVSGSKGRGAGAHRRRTRLIRFSRLKIPNFVLVQGGRRPAVLPQHLKEGFFSDIQISYHPYDPVSAFGDRSAKDYEGGYGAAELTILIY